MLILAWICMVIAILAAGLLLGDLKAEMEYNEYMQYYGASADETEGEYYGLQETAYRQSRNVLRRCC